MLALMRFLAGMGPNVNSESAPLDEALSTPRSHTRVGTLIGVYAIMSLQVRLAVEALPSHISRSVGLIGSTRYLVACLPVTLKWSSIRLILYKFHDIHPVPSPSIFLRIELAAVTTPRPFGRPRSHVL
jgi:hypothetical protein